MSAGKDSLPWAVAAPSWVCAALVVKGKRYALDTSGIREYRLGRLQDICIEHQTASRFHALIAHHKDGGLHIVDQKSANGTFINGKEIPPATPVRLEHGTIVRFGECPDDFKVDIVDNREAKKDMMSQLAGYDDDDVSDERDGSRFVSAGYRNAAPERTNRENGRGWDRNARGDDSRGRDTSANGEGRGRGGNFNPNPFGKNRERDVDQDRGRGSIVSSGNPGDRKGSSNFSEGPTSSYAGAAMQGKGGAPSATGGGVSDVAQKRKMLWGSKAKEENTKNTATWTNLSSTLRDPDAQDKFLKLMGGKKPGNEAEGAAGAGEEHDFGGMQSAMEREYHAALYRTHGHSKHGLG